MTRVTFNRARGRRLFNLDHTNLGVARLRRFLETTKTFWKQRMYANDPAEELIQMGADLLVSINASPFNKSKMKMRCEMVSHRARAAGIPIVFVNLVGGNDGIIFDGASIISDAQGKIILQAPPFEEFVGTVDLSAGMPDTRCLPATISRRCVRALVLGIPRLRAQEPFRQSAFRIVRWH
jgi:NAD+ synthase (glutamine-hydrolysing)